jgi:hypothetical protein
MLDKQLCDPPQMTIHNRTPGAAAETVAQGNV